MQLRQHVFNSEAKYLGDNNRIRKTLFQLGAERGAGGYTSDPQFACYPVHANRWVWQQLVVAVACHGSCFATGVSWICCKVVTISSQHLTECLSK